MPWSMVLIAIPPRPPSTSRICAVLLDVQNARLEFTAVTSLGPTLPIIRWRSQIIESVFEL